MRTLCVDFDGVLHMYKSGWHGASVVHDGPVPGAIAWLAEMSTEYDIAVYSTRSITVNGQYAVRTSLLGWLETDLGVLKGGAIFHRLRFPTSRPSAHLYIDDRGFQFCGSFPSKEEIEAFVPWNQAAQLPAATRAAQFETELRALLRRYEVTLTAEGGLVGYSAPFAAVNLSNDEYFDHNTIWKDAE